jgi:hypothetical protein
MNESIIEKVKNILNKAKENNNNNNDNNKNNNNTIK